MNSKTRVSFEFSDLISFTFIGKNHVMRSSNPSESIAILMNPWIVNWIPNENTPEVLLNIGAIKKISKTRLIKYPMKNVGIILSNDFDSLCRAWLITMIPKYRKDPNK